MLLCSELAPKFSLVVRDCMGWDLAPFSKTHFLMRLRFSFMIAEISGQLQLRRGTQADGCGHQRGPCMGCSEDSLRGKRGCVARYQPQEIPRPFYLSPASA